MSPETEQETHEHRSPIDSQVTWAGKWSTTQDVSESVAASQIAFDGWRRTPLQQRVAVLEKFASLLQSNKEPIAKTISLEMGKPYWESLTEVSGAVAKVANSIEAFQTRRRDASEPSGNAISQLRFRPLGPTVVLGPFNLPLHLPGAHIVPSLLAGNTVLFKPSEKSPAVGDWIDRLWKDAGLPKNVLQTLHGGIEVAKRLVEAEPIRGLFFTGSYVAGKAIHQQLAGRPECLLALEMGGNNPLVIESVENEEAALNVMHQSCFITAGQRCTCARRILVVDSPANRRLVQRFVRSMERVRVDLPFADPAPFLGTVVSASAAEQVLQAQIELERAGAKPLQRSRRVGGNAALLSPGIWEVGSQVPAKDEEVFGPLATLQFVKDFEEAIEVANRTKYGLAAGLLSTSQDLFQHFVAEVRAGIVNWNSPTTGATGRLPFGGVGASGNHRSSGYFAADYCNDPVASVEVSQLSAPTSWLPGLQGVLDN